MSATGVRLEADAACRLLAVGRGGGGLAGAAILLAAVRSR